MTAMLAVGSSPNALTEISIDPSSCSWGLQDISDSNAGRVLNGSNTMYKNRTSQKRKLALTWQNITLAQAHEIISAFNPEYVFVRYMDVLSGVTEVREFYVGDRTAPFLWYNLPNKGTRMTSVSFDIIER